jgi:hypothetical protein
MPFGTKKFPEHPDRLYDFDKVYRVIIQRAIREAGMRPVRADESVGSAIIHTDMFRSLRDRPVVLADLSLDNPNVFYELGIRHVMSTKGTVLIARQGSVLPFDVKLSRTLFYDFDGTSLDWEEVERVVKRLTLALREAREGQPDSPVHALLQSVLPESMLAGDKPVAEQPEAAADAERLSSYQEELADLWIQTGQPQSTLLDRHRTTVFGIRSLGFFLLKQAPLGKEAKRLANQLNDGAQYRLANRLYSQLYEAGALTRGSQLAYASSYSEEHNDSDGADRAIAIASEVLSQVEQEHSAQRDKAQAVREYAEAYRRLAGLRQWKWQLTQDAADLDQAIESFGDAIRFTQRGRDLGTMGFPGFLAQARMKQLLLLRIRDQNLDRPDTERHRDAILELKPRPGDDPRGVSYLGWFQVIVLADMNAGERMQQRALETFTEDTKLKSNPEYWEIGRRQYVLIRRFLEQFASHLRNPTLIGRISQVLQAGGLRS